MYFVIFFFFFFQAEDGIRDLTVTGVQTVLFRSIVFPSSCSSMRSTHAPVPSLRRPRSAAQMWNVTAHLRADRKSTRLNSSHSQISYAVFCLKKKNKNTLESST